MPSSLWQNSDFRRLWAAQTASQLGEHASLVVLPLLAVLTLDVGAGELGVLRATGQAPMLLALVAGVWVDRLRTRTVMVLADLGRASALVVVAFAAVTLPLLLAVAFVIGALSVLFDVAYQASLVRLVRRDQLIRGNSALEGTRSAAQMAGPALGGLPFAAPVAAALFAVSSGFLARIRHRETVPPHRPGSGLGVRFVARDPLLRTIGLASAAFQFFLAATMTAYLLFLPRELHLSGATIGLILAATGPGALIGSLLAARLNGGRVLIVAALLGDGTFLVVPALQPGSPFTIAALVAVNLVFGAFGQLVNVLVMAIRQSATPDAMQGRVAATITFAGMGMTPFGSLLGGYLAGAWDLRTGMLVTAAGMLLSPLLMAFSPLRLLQDKS
ncbi:MFS transporter [Actinoplanes sp. LDG1-06]|uniref:MFS transporter n=1 Tax=Paractinoplanes ovalisporus TaxID=2810368 RepID=A0ABS2ATW5_9ACTN|nr:MFS transporter [Actinoplanes ovalisporus]MBM2623163.1 MFS transporter [Actinoplanes ovalisporus]